MQITGAQLEEITRWQEEKASLLSPHACRDDAAIRRDGGLAEDRIIRPAFFRDVDRVIHSRAFSRYIDKTQVFYLLDNEHITHRAIHIQLVAKIGRTIGRALSLNEDLIEAIALGHDIGHPPYGHFGEECLSALCKTHHIGSFRHDVQSVQFLDTIEDTNLTLQVLDGILCHNGEVHNTRLTPDLITSFAGLSRKKEQLLHGGDPAPGTLEGCVVRVADTIAYLGRDLQDAIEVGFLTSSLPGLPDDCRRVFALTGDYRRFNASIIDTVCRDVIACSFGCGEVRFSPEVSACVQALKKYNYDMIYENEVLHAQDDTIRALYAFEFERFLTDIEKEHTDSLIYKDLIRAEYVSPAYIAAASPAELVRDYIAGMTDKYFESIPRELLIPKRHFRNHAGKMGLDKLNVG
ncbi:deoxyguanosinetriphosphate triphosphohydrolase family protein [Methanogenium sp. MK-MG]|uniref:deoxyguanosinetriphosphate triphosphohydrolase family protein n=1 Tax=Methanogenium sp. MK-MG TaxID=2599926 RepID=UPI0013ED3A0B|nr:HD domain-containing protein [Methanogenium sp. MK-MG]KAF1075405.1 Deoxyguanosinetriphosphate triphosphohydrolase-like protein [Methanogenium sp. MK-MG]